MKTKVTDLLQHLSNGTLSFVEEVVINAIRQEIHLHPDEFSTLLSKDQCYGVKKDFACTTVVSYDVYRLKKFLKLLPDRVDHIDIVLKEKGLLMKGGEPTETQGYVLLLAPMYAEDEEREPADIIMQTMKRATPEESVPNGGSP